MKQFKKFASLTLAAIMVLSCLTLFSSCKGKAAWPVDEATGLTELYIGSIGPSTGDYANYGLSVKKGAQLAVDEINKAGGVQGFKFCFNFQDSEADPAKAVNAYGKQMDEGMKVSLGAVLSGESASVVAAAKEDTILVLSPSASSVAAIQGNDRAFRVCFSDPSQGTASAKFISEHNLAKKVAIFYASDVDYSKGLYDTFKAECREKGIEILTEQSYTDSTKTDFSAQIDAIKNSGAELVFMPIYAAEAATFLTQAKGKLDGITCFGCDGLDGLLGKIDNTANAEGVMMLTPFAADAKNEKVQKFVEAYKAAYNGEVPDQFAADGYDAIYTIAEALKAAKLSADDVEDFDQRMVEVMTKITVEGVTGTMTWNPDGNTNKDAMAMIFKDGKAVAFTGEE